MDNSILIIDNDTRYVDKVLSSLNDTLKISADTMSNLDKLDISESLDDYDIFIIRYSSQTKSTIKLLCDEEKLVIILASRDTDDIYNGIHKYSFSDYIFTSESKDISIMTNMINRLLQNMKMKALVVDDSKLSRDTLEIMLQRQGLECVTCNDGQEAYDYLINPESQKIDIVIADYEMPKLDGYMLTKMLRTKFLYQELPILILSGTQNTKIIASFLKIGANDYIPKPFINEEFIARLSNTLNTLNMFRSIKSMALTDHLTGLHNRAYLYEVGTKTIDIMKRNNSEVSLGMCDIDNFKAINDTYGHDFGDKALKLVAQAVNNSLRNSDICARFGGEEFIFILPDCPIPKAQDIAKKVCKSVEDLVFKREDKKIKLTISIGLCSEVSEINTMITTADSLMYEAKEGGKNRVCHD